MMKKKIITIVMGMMFCAGLFGGCGQTEMKQDNAQQVTVRRKNRKKQQKKEN